MKTAVKSNISFNEYTIDPTRRILLKNGETVRLNPKTFDLLLALIGRQGEIVSKEELLDMVWGEQFIEEGNLTVNISLLRKALGEKANEPRFLVTIPGRGYKFIAPVSVGSPPNAAMNAGDVEAVDMADESHEARETAVALPVQNPAVPRSVFWAVSFAAVFIAAFFVFIYFNGFGEFRWGTAPAHPVIEPSQQRLVSTFPGSHFQPSFSPDGNLVAFVQSAGDVSQIWIKDLRTSEPVQITSGSERAERPRWSPAGGEIVYTCHSQGKPDICSVPVNGGKPTKIINGGRNPNWSWDGNRLVFERGYEILTANKDGSNQRAVAGVPSTDLLLVDRFPAFSPDGALIAFFQNDRSPMGDYWIVPSAGGEAKRLTSDLSFGGAPAWMPDGKHIIFPSQRGGSMTLWRVAVEGNKEPEPVLSGAGEDTSPEISRDGSKLIYTNTRKRFVITITDSKTGESRGVRESGLDVINPSFSPDGSKIAFFGFDNSGDLHVYKIDVGGENLVQVTSGKNVKNIQPQWSADGQTIYFYQMHPTYSFRKIPAVGGESTEIASDWEWGTHNEAHVSPDETKIVYTKLEKGKSAAAFIRDIATGKETEFGLPLRFPRWSHDGKFIAGTLIVGGKQAKDEIMICAVDGSLCRRIANGIHPRWSADDSKIYYYGPNDHESYPVWVVSTGGGDAKKVTDLYPMSPIDMYFHVSLREEIVWIRLDQRKSELWLTDLSLSK